VLGTGPPWLLAARRDAAEGVEEIPGPRAHERIARYHSYAPGEGTSDEIPWCSSAMCAWMEECGILSPRSRRARSWLGWGRILDAPVPGCVVVLRRGADPASGHVTLWLGRGEPGRFAGLGGNQGDSVCTSTFRTSDVLGYRWPRSYPLP